MTYNTLKIGLLFLGFAFLTSNNVLAQEQGEKRENRKPPTYKELLKKMDTNEDGKLSKKEVKGPIKKDFDKIDTNDDGFISKEELEKAPKPERRKKN